jgi:hypothetical protein
MRKVLFWLLFAVTMAVYGTMLGWSLPAISAAAGGLVPFDLRPGGYGLADAQQFLTALSANGASFYRNVQHRLDMAFPALIGLTMFFALAALLPARLGGWRYLIALPALFATAFDYVENRMVGLMLEAGAAGLTPELVGTASTTTQIKSIITTVVMSAILILLIWRGVRWLMRRRPASAA